MYKDKGTRQARIHEFFRFPRKIVRLGEGVSVFSIRICAFRSTVTAVFASFVVNVTDSQCMSQYVTDARGSGGSNAKMRVTVAEVAVKVAKVAAKVAKN